jgi:hypothetical protein
MIEAGAPSTGVATLCYPKRCARPTGGSHGRTGGSLVQRFKGANRTAAPKWRKQRGPGRLSRRTSENSVTAKFAEFPFYEVG